MAYRSADVPLERMLQVWPPSVVTKRPPLVPTAQPCYASRNRTASIVLLLEIWDCTYHADEDPHPGGLAGVLLGDAVAGGEP